MIILLGLMFEVTAKFAIMFITVQYNVTQVLDEKSESVNLYQYGPKDVATVFFYLLIAVILHALIQEYILDVSTSTSKLGSRHTGSHCWLFVTQWLIILIFFTYALEHVMTETETCVFL